jgi:flagellar hook-basal body complex protein FliE
MIPAIPSIPSVGAAESTGAAQIAAGTSGSNAGAAGAAGGTDGASSGSFENILGQAIDSLNGATNNASNLSLEAAAGNASVADATVASTEADLDTQLASALTDKAVTALNTIMDMQA